VRNFLDAEKPSTAEDIARELEAPVRLVRSVLSELTEARVLSEVCSENREGVAYQPACDIQRLTVSGVIERLDQQGIESIPIAESADLTKVRETLRRFHEVNANSPANLKLQDL
jgi:membrane protein